MYTNTYICVYTYLHMCIHIYKIQLHKCVYPIFQALSKWLHRSDKQKGLAIPKQTSASHSKQQRHTCMEQYQNFRSLQSDHATFKSGHKRDGSDKYGQQTQDVACKLLQQFNAKGEMASHSRCQSQVKCSRHRQPVYKEQQQNKEGHKAQLYNLRFNKWNMHIKSATNLATTNIYGTYPVQHLPH